MLSMMGGFPQLFSITSNICVGTSNDEKQVIDYVDNGEIDCVLIVAHDMDPTYGWLYHVEYAHVGIVDGPGNPLSVYHAAVLSLASLSRERNVLICCHDGSRSLAVAIMYLYLMGEGPSWDETIERLTAKGVEVPPIHAAHKKAFTLMDWGMLARVLDSEVSID